VALINGTIYNVSDDYSVTEVKEFQPYTYKKTNNTGGTTTATMSKEDVERAFRLTLTPNFD
jgi:hypothetical protein